MIEEINAEKARNEKRNRAVQIKRSAPRGRVEARSLGRERVEVGLGWPDALVRGWARLPTELHARVASGVRRNGGVDRTSIGLLGRLDLVRGRQDLGDDAVLTGGRGVEHFVAMRAEPECVRDFVVAKAAVTAVAAVTAATTGYQEQDEGESREQESHGASLSGSQPPEAERSGTRGRVAAMNLRSQKPPIGSRRATEKPTLSNSPSLRRDARRRRVRLPRPTFSRRERLFGGQSFRLDEALLEVLPIEPFVEPFEPGRSDHKKGEEKTQGDEHHERQTNANENESVHGQYVSSGTQGCLNRDSWVPK